MSKDDESRLMAVELAKRLLVDAIWKTASIEVDGISFRDTQEIFEGRAPANMAVDDIIVVNNIKRAWMFLFENVDQPVNWQYMSEYNRILGEGLIRDAGKLRTNDVRIGGTDWIPELPTMESSHDGISSLMKIESPEDRALLMFCKITRGQWFNDGNERTALMTANHALINAGVGVFSISPSLKREFTTRLLRYYESNDDVPFHSWLKDNAIGRLPGGITSAESRRLELKRSRAAGPNCASPSSASAVTPGGWTCWRNGTAPPGSASSLMGSDASGMKNKCCSKN